MHRKIRVGGTYDDQTVTEVWGGNQVLNVGWTTPEWSSAKGAVKVVFTDAFSTVKPTSLYKWFYSFQELKAIKGLENLNTVDVTNMNATFASCKSLICLDVNSFDVSKVTNTTTMFSNCSSLETIFCNYVWPNVSNHETSDGMFFGCVKLKGAVEYDGAKVDGNMATYTQGYFTKLYIGDGNTLYWPNNEMTIGSQRAYFQLKGLEAGTPTQSPTIRAFVLDFGDDSNGISSLDYGQRMMDNDGWYTLDGRKIVNRTREALGSSKKSVNRKLPKGLYIHGGRKVVVH